SRRARHISPRGGSPSAPVGRRYSHGNRGSPTADDPLERGQGMTAAQFEGLQVDEAAEVLAWRFDALCRTGYDLDAAAVLAANVEGDLHDAVDLVESGCPPHLPTKILLSVHSSQPRRPNPRRRFRRRGSPSTATG